MKWTRHPEYLTSTIDGITVDWNPEDGPRIHLTIDGATPEEALRILDTARLIAATCDTEARTTWENPCDTSD